jgi:hypothetical protein
LNSLRSRLDSRDSFLLKMEWMVFVGATY